MLVQTIQISFSSYAADTIRIHTGETGREILFAPDMEISGNYSADFIIIKPDDTFAIAAATITDGKINVEIPEQAGAVAGAGHYILKIYDSGETCIYSASGGFMVDDHLLTDGIIESVAEVYGYNFPQDFLVIDDTIISDNKTWSSEKIAGMIDDDNVLYDKTWSSDKIEREIGSAPGFHVYSTTEQMVGRWIDGSPVFEKVIDFGSDTQIDYMTWTLTNISLDNITRLISISGLSGDGNAYYGDIMGGNNGGYLQLLTARNNTYITIRYLIFSYVKNEI